VAQSTIGSAGTRRVRSTASRYGRTSLKGREPRTKPASSVDDRLPEGLRCAPEVTEADATRLDQACVRRLDHIATTPWPALRRDLEGFVIVSSDSDFTRLATRLRESGMIGYGLGRRTTPTPFVAACDRFIYLDLLSEEPHEPQQPASDDEEPPPPLRGSSSDRAATVDALIAASSA
jgi:NYN domain